MNFDLWKGIRDKVSKQTWICFVTGMVSGWITHFYMLTNKLPNWDDVHNISSYGGGADFGRWMLEYIHNYGGKHSVPAIHGMLMIFFVSIAACLIYSLLHLKTEMAAVLIPLILTTFPSLGCTLTFMFTAHTYGVAIFILVLAVWLLRRYQWGFLPCSILLIMGLGIYQSYICLVIVLMLMGLLVDQLEGADKKKTWINGVICVVELAVSVFIYQKLVHVFFQNFDQEQYAGVDKMGQVNLVEIPKMLGRCYKRCLEYFIWKPFSFVNKPMQICNILCVCLCIGFAVYLFVAKKLYQNWVNALFYWGMLGLIPLGVSFIYFMAPEASFSMLMLYGYAFVYILLVMLLEKSSYRFQVSKKSAKKTIAYVVTWIVFLTILLNAYENYLLINTAYFRSQIAQERVKEYYNRVIMLVEQQEDYQEGDAVVILGEFHYLDNPSPIEIDVVETERFRELSGIALENGLLTSGIRKEFLETYFGFETYALSAEETEAVMESEQYRNMSLFPNEGCIQKMDDIWIVKLCENE